MDAWLGGAAEQLQGQIASAEIPLSRMISPQLYWGMSDSEFRPYEGNGAGELQAHQGGSEADYSGGTGADCQ